MTATRRDKNLQAPAQKAYYNYGPQYEFPRQKDYLAAVAARRSRGARAYTATPRRSVLLAAPSGAPLEKPLTGAQRRAVKRQQACAAPAAAAPPATKPEGVYINAAGDADTAPTADDGDFPTANAAAAAAIAPLPFSAPLPAPVVHISPVPAAPAAEEAVAPVPTASATAPAQPTAHTVARVAPPLLLLHNISWGSATASPVGQQTPSSAIRTPTRLVVSVSSHQLPSPAATPAPAASAVEAVSAVPVAVSAPLAAPSFSSDPAAATTTPSAQGPSLVTAALAAGALAAGTVALAGGAFAIGAGIVACCGAGLAAGRTAAWVGGRKAALDKFVGEAVMGPEGYARYQGWLAVL